MTDQTWEKEKGPNPTVKLMLKEYDSFLSLCGYAGSQL